MDALKIKHLLASKGHSVTSISNGLGIARPSVSQVIHGHRPSRRVSQAIADAIGLPLEDVFPKYRKDKAA